MVYFGSIKDDTLKTFVSKVNVSKSYSLEDIVESDYWNVEEIDTSLKCIPLFNTEEIVSSNPNDIVLGVNKCLIAIPNEDTVITCKGSSNPTIVGEVTYKLYAYTIDNKILYCIVTDNLNNLIVNTEIMVYKNDTLQTTVKTGTNGICKYTTSSNGTYKFIFNNTNSNTVVIT